MMIHSVTCNRCGAILEYIRETWYIILVIKVDIISYRITVHTREAFSIVRDWIPIEIY